MLTLYVATTPFINRTPISHSLKEKFLERETAVELIKEMSKVCGIDLEKSSLIFSCKSISEAGAEKCQLEILKAYLDVGSRTCLYALMDERGWKFKEESDKIVIIETLPSKI
jgi:hypothetical protein